jgi:hypothetical protein
VALAGKGEGKIRGRKNRPNPSQAFGLIHMFSGCNIFYYYFMPTLVDVINYFTIFFSQM